jgi:VWFA-related protein
VSRWLIVLLFCCAVNAFAQTPEPDEPVRVSTELVIVDTQVARQADGKPVGGMKPEDFILTENGVAQDVTFFSQDKLALSVVLLFDLTDTSQPVLKRLAMGAMEALAHFKPQDEIAVVAYASKILLLQSFTRDRIAVIDAITNASQMDAPEQLALFNEAVWLTADYMQAAATPKQRRVILWLSDNLPNKPTRAARTEKEALDQLFENDISVFGVMMQTKEGKLIDWVGRPKGSGNMFKYAEQTGGEIIKAETENVSERLGEIIDRMRARYALGYVSTNTGVGFRNIHVKLKPEVEKRIGKVTLRGKAGYFAK